MSSLEMEGELEFQESDIKMDPELEKDFSCMDCGSGRYRRVCCEGRIPLMRSVCQGSARSTEKDRETARKLLELYEEKIGHKWMNHIINLGSQPLHDEPYNGMRSILDTVPMRLLFRPGYEEFRKSILEFSDTALANKIPGCLIYDFLVNKPSWWKSRFCCSESKIQFDDQ